MEPLPHTRLLALDCDGTVVGPDNVVTANVADAVRAAEQAGLRVCLATGRSFAEALPVWRQLGLVGPRFEPIVCVGGALIADVPSGRTLMHRPIPHDAAVAFAQVLGEAGYCALAFVDGWRHDVDYLITEAGNVDEVETRWLSQMDVRVRRVADLADAEVRDVLRVSAVIDADVGDDLVAFCRARLDGALTMHPILAPNYGVTVLEAFAAGTDKLAAIRYVAQSWRMGMADVVAVGDDVNDIPLLQGAGLSVAMPHAPAAVRDAADRVADEGLASLIRTLIEEVDR